MKLDRLLMVSAAGWVIWNVWYPIPEMWAHGLSTAGILLLLGDRWIFNPNKK